MCSIPFRGLQQCHSEARDMRLADAVAMCSIPFRGLQPFNCSGSPNAFTICVSSQCAQSPSGDCNAIVVARRARLSPRAPLSQCAQSPSGDCNLLDHVFVDGSYAWLSHCAQSPSGDCRSIRSARTFSAMVATRSIPSGDRNAITAGAPSRTVRTHPRP